MPLLERGIIAGKETPDELGYLLVYSITISTIGTPAYPISTHQNHPLHNEAIQLDRKHQRVSFEVFLSEGWHLTVCFGTAADTRNARFSIRRLKAWKPMPHLGGQKMKASEGIDRRIAPRFIPEADIYLVIRPNFEILGRLKDISSSGLAFEYMAFDSYSKQTSMEMDIFSSEGSKLYMSHIPVKVVYDVKLGERSFAGFETRRCGVRFKALSDPQTDKLHVILQNCAQSQMPATL
jgi:hypothetical protein